MGIHLDSREPTKFRKMFTAKGLDFEIRQLMTGDVVVWNDENPDVRAVIERKRLDDLVSGAYGNRMWEQFSRMAEEDFGILIITGNFKKLTAKMPFRVMSQIMEETIATAVIRYNFRSVIWLIEGVDDANELGFIMMVKMIQKVVDGQMDMIPQKKIKIAKDKRIQTLINLFGLDIGTSKKLLEDYGTVRKIMELTDTQLVKVKGVGPAKLKLIRFIMDESFNKGNFKEETAEEKKCTKCGNLMTIIKMSSGNIFTCKKCTFGHLQ